MHIMGALAEFERGLIVERTPAGIQQQRSAAGRQTAAYRPSRRAFRVIWPGGGRISALPLSIRAPSAAAISILFSRNPRSCALGPQASLATSRDHSAARRADAS